MVGRKSILFSIMFYGIIKILGKNTLEGGSRPKKSENHWYKETVRPMIL